MSKLPAEHKNALSRMLNRRQLGYEELYATLLHIIDTLANPDVIKTKLNQKMVSTHPTAEQMANWFEVWSELGSRVEGGVSQMDECEMVLDALGTNNKEEDGLVYPLLLEEAKRGLK